MPVTRSRSAKVSEVDLDSPPPPEVPRRQSGRGRKTTSKTAETVQSTDVESGYSEATTVSSKSSSRKTTKPSTKNDDSIVIDDDSIQIVESLPEIAAKPVTPQKEITAKPISPKRIAAKPISSNEVVVKTSTPKKPATQRTPMKKSPIKEKQDETTIETDTQQNSSLIRLLDVLNGRISDSWISPDLSKHSQELLAAIRTKHVDAYRDDTLMREIVEQESIELIDAVVQHVQYIPEWFLRRALSVLVKHLEARTQICNPIVRRISSSAFHRSRMVKELRKLPFEDALTVYQQMLTFLDGDHEMENTLSVYEWISALVESHFTEFTLADEAYDSLEGINKDASSIMKNMSLWFEVDGQLKALIAASTDPGHLFKEDIDYWHGYMEI